MADAIAPDIEYLPLFCDLQKPARQYLQSRLRKFDFSADQTILDYGKKGEFIGLVGHGLVDLYKPDGSIQTMLPGEMLGEQMLLFQKPSPYTIRARSDSSLWVLTRSDWLRALQIPVSTRAQTGPSRPKRNPFRTIASLVLLISLVLFLSPELPQVTNRAIVQTLVNAEQREWAAEYIKMNIWLQPDSPTLYEELGSIYFENGDYYQASAAFQEAVRRDASSASALNNLGVALLEMDQPEQAVSNFTLAANLDPGNAEIFFNQGTAYLKSGKSELAAEAFHRSAELAPDYLDAKVQLGNLWMHEGEFSKALMIWEEILYWTPEQKDARLGRGMLSVLTGHPQDSLPDLEAALLADPLNPISHFYFGLALQALENPYAAATEFEAVKVLSRDSELIALADYHLKETTENP